MGHMCTHDQFMSIIAKSPQYFKIIIIQLKLINFKKWKKKFPGKAKGCFFTVLQFWIEVNDNGKVLSVVVLRIK